MQPVLLKGNAFVPPEAASLRSLSGIHIDFTVPPFVHSIARPIDAATLRVRGPVAPNSRLSPTDFPFRLRPVRW